ncbi:MAG: SGNH/GDSL hydrolase family protein [bacterium]
MRLILLFFLLGIILLSCKEQDINPVDPGGDPPQDSITHGDIRYLALGDSYTIGQSVPESERWPLQLAANLSASGMDMAEVEIIARTGWTTSELSLGIEAEEPQGPYELVSLLIGVNNQYRRLDTAEYRLEFSELLQQSIAFAGGDTNRVFVVSIPDYSVTPFAQTLDTARIAREIDDFNAINFSETVKFGIEYINITPISRLARYDSTLIANDGLHPSGKMYGQWVKLIAPVVKQKLE